MIEALPWPLRKLLAFALLGLLVWGVAELAVRPLLAEHRALRDEIEAERRLRGRYAALAGETAAAATPAVAAPARGFIEAASEPIALAALQTQVTALVQRAGLQARSVAPLAPRERGGLRLIGVRVQASAGLDRLQRLLHAAAESQPYLLIEAMQLSSRPVAGSGERDGEAVEARLDLWAAVRRREAP